MSVEGGDQARALAVWLDTGGGAGERPRRVVSSPLSRARDTAVILASALEVPLRLEPLLVEVSFGVAQGTPKAELDSRFPGALETLRNGGDLAGLVPRAESRREAARRASIVIDSLLARHNDETVLVVTHGALLLHLVSGLLGIPAGRRLTANIPNTSISTFEIHGNPMRGGLVHVVRLFAVPHLPSARPVRVPGG